MTEQQKADELSSWLGVQVRENQAGALHYSLCKYLSEDAHETGVQGSALSGHNMHSCISNVKSRHFESCYVLFCFLVLH